MIPAFRFIMSEMAKLDAKTPGMFGMFFCAGFLRGCFFFFFFRGFFSDFFNHKKTKNAKIVNPEHVFFVVVFWDLWERRANVQKQTYITDFHWQFL